MTVKAEIRLISGEKITVDISEEEFKGLVGALNRMDFVSANSLVLCSDQVVYVKKVE